MRQEDWGWLTQMTQYMEPDSTRKTRIFSTRLLLFRLSVDTLPMLFACFLAPVIFINEAETAD